MNKQKALFRHEMRTMIWFLLAGILMAVMVSYMLYNMISECFSFDGSLIAFVEETKITFTSRLSSALSKISIASVFAIVVMGIVQFNDLHSRKSQEYLHSLPFTKRERFVVKAVVGYMVITAVMIVALVGVLCVRQAVMPAIIKSNLLSSAYKLFLGNDTLWHAVGMVIVTWLSFMAVYSIMLLAHAFVNKGILAGVIGFGITAAPFWIYQVVLMLMMETPYFDTDSQLYQNWLGFRGYFGVLFGVANSNAENIQLGDTTNFGAVVYYEKFWVLFVICLAVIAMCMAVSTFYIGRTDLARGGMLVQKRPARIFLCAGIGLCFGAGISAFACLWFWNEVMLLEFAVIGLISAFLIYFLCEKLFRKVFG